MTIFRLNRSRTRTGTSKGKSTFSSQYHRIINKRNQARIPYSVYDQDLTNNRKTNWSMGLHWALGPLRELVHESILSQIQETQVDPHVPTHETDRLPLYNGQTGELIKELVSKKFYRLRRDKFRNMLMTGILVKWGKQLCDITYSTNGERVTAKFTDGSEDTGRILVGCDGPHSSVRRVLVGDEKANVTPIDFASTMCFTQHTREHALFLRASPHHPLYQVAAHPDGYCAWLSLHDGDDLDHPENWTFFHYISYPEPKSHISNRTNDEHVAYQKQLASLFVDPWKSVFEWMKPDHPVWYSKLRNWDPSLPEHRWDNKLGRVTLAGDAAHPMTFQRGQGLNHAIMDAYTIKKAIDSFWELPDLEKRADAVGEYEKEMIARGGEEVRLSEENSIAIHDWRKVMESPSLRSGLALDTDK